MSLRTAQRVCFLAIAFLVPWPMTIMAPVFAPAVHYVLLAGVVAAVILAEGAAGPVPLIQVVFAGHALVYVVGSWLLSLVLARVIVARVPASRRAIVVWGAVAIAVGLAIAIEGYATPLSRRPTVNLLGVLA